MGPLQLTVQGTNRLVFSDVWIGEVWLASGQSNMEMSVHASAGADTGLASGCAGLHWFQVSHATSLTPSSNVNGSWAACTPATAAAVSGVAYYFARELQHSLGVPIGIIQAAWGGTPAEAWTPRAALSADPALSPLVAALDRAANDPARSQELQRRLREWESKAFVQDSGNRGETQGLARQWGNRSAGWETMTIPQVWEKSGLQMDGAVWFQRDLVLPETWAGTPLTVSLGPLDDFDVTYWNGEKIGATGIETPQFWSTPRRYVVPAKLVRPGRNLIAVRIFDRGGDGGFAGAPEQLYVQPSTGALAPISLAGTWSYKIERRVAPVTVDWHARPTLLGADEPSSPTVLWNAMVAPVTPTPIAGVIWYQGESNVGRASEYQRLFPSLIRAWRQAWNAPALPFLFVQLPNYEGSPSERSQTLGNSSWADLREAQTAALRLPRVGMAVAIDIGESKEIHPHNKREVARRLAQIATQDVYARGGFATGPRYESARREGRGMRVRFGSVAHGLCTTDGAPPKGFIVAGADRVWHRADAVIEDLAVVVSSPDVTQPTAVRYAWENDPVATLRDLADLPAAPFRTDAW
jgi:sialate O-acetylesterase